MISSVLRTAASLPVVASVVSRVESTALFCAEAFVHAGLSKLQVGSLKFVLPDGECRMYGNSQDSLRAEVVIKSRNFFLRVLKDADIGVAESFMAGEWECNNPVNFFKIIIANRDIKAVNDKDFLLSFIGRFWNKFLHYKNQNTIAGSKKNIQDHYDLSNDLFKLFLDDSMTYSCALFRSDSETLAEGQRNKLMHVIRKARISSTDHVLEVGCGWGSFAILAAKTTGCKMTCITLSEQQKKEVEIRARRAGLQDKISVLLEDYRTMQGSFDKIVSIEMLEAVGLEYYDEYFSSLDRLLKPNGLVVIQVITTPDQRLPYTLEGADFIQKHIFPGSLCPSLTVLQESMTRSSTLIVHHLENIGYHYAKTLAAWCVNFERNESKVKALGFDSVFFRKWVYYFRYCEAGFATRTLGDLHLVLTRPNNDLLPPYEEDVWRLPHPSQMSAESRDGA